LRGIDQPLERRERHTAAPGELALREPNAGDLMREIGRDPDAGSGRHRDGSFGPGDRRGGTGRPARFLQVTTSWPIIAHVAPTINSGWWGWPAGASRPVDGAPPVWRGRARSRRRRGRRGFGRAGRRGDVPRHRCPRPPYLRWRRFRLRLPALG